MNVVEATHIWLLVGTSFASLTRNYYGVVPRDWWGRFTGHCCSNLQSTSSISAKFVPKMVLFRKLNTFCVGDFEIFLFLQLKFLWLYGWEINIYYGKWTLIFFFTLNVIEKSCPFYAIIFKSLNYSVLREHSWWNELQYHCWRNNSIAVPNFQGLMISKLIQKFVQ